MGLLLKEQDVLEAATIPTQQELGRPVIHWGTVIYRGTGSAAETRVSLLHLKGQGGLHSIRQRAKWNYLWRNQTCPGQIIHIPPPTDSGILFLSTFPGTQHSPLSTFPGTQQRGLPFLTYQYILPLSTIATLISTYPGFLPSERSKYKSFSISPGDLTSFSEPGTSSWSSKDSSKWLT